MNGFANHGLDEDAFSEKRSNIVQAFDAFRKFTIIFFYPSILLFFFSCNWSRLGI